VKFDGIVFDLDGTLWDTCATCAIGWNRVVTRHGIRFRRITEHDVRSVAGKPHETCIREVFRNLPEPDLRVLVDETGSEDNRLVLERGGAVYDGVAEGLTLLAERHPLYIVSNCQAGYVEAFFDVTGLGRFFQGFECAGRTGLPKADNLSSVVGRGGLNAPVFVGDTDGDRAAARQCDIPFVHVKYGFGACAAAEACVDDFGALCTLLRTGD
jgi:phosphoglycolate phosphatase